MGSQERRRIYVASLEAHIDAIHETYADVLRELVPPEELASYYGLNQQTAKVRAQITPAGIVLRTVPCSPS